MAGKLPNTMLRHQKDELPSAVLESRFFDLCSVLYSITKEAAQSFFPHAHPSVPEAWEALRIKLHKELTDDRACLIDKTRINQ